MTEDIIDYSAGTSASKLLANVTNQTPNAHTPNEDCNSLSPKVRDIWSKIPHDIKTVLLRGRNGSLSERINKYNKDDCKTAKPPSFAHKKYTKANLHELLAELISETSVSEKNDEDISKDVSDS